MWVQVPNALGYSVPHSQSTSRKQPVYGPGPIQDLCFLFSFFFKDLFLLFFIGKDIQRGETERKIFRPMIHSQNERNGRCYSYPKPGASSGSPTQVQGPKALGHPQLLSQATGRDLEGKRGCRDRTGAQMGSRHVQGEDLNHCATVPDPGPMLSR